MDLFLSKKQSVPKASKLAADSLLLNNKDLESEDLYDYGGGSSPVL